MLVLSRKKGEKITIETTGNSATIVITLISADHNAIKIGIDAPRDVTIMRNELLTKVHDSTDTTACQCDPYDIIDGICLHCGKR